MVVAVLGSSDQYLSSDPGGSRLRISTREADGLCLLSEIFTVYPSGVSRGSLSDSLRHVVLGA